MSPAQEETIAEIKNQWRRLWQERVDDKVRAECIASDDYFQLFVGKGTVIYATRRFRPLNLKDILDQNRIENSERFIPRNPLLGGWSKFIKTSICPNATQRHNRALLYAETKKECLKPRKSGRGWLHK